MAITENYILSEQSLSKAFPIGILYLGCSIKLLNLQQQNEMTHRHR